MMSWQPLLQDFSTYLQLTKGLAKNTCWAYTRAVHRFYAWSKTIAIQAPTQVTEASLQQFLQVLYEEGMTPKTQACILGGLQAFFKFLLYKQHITTNPAERIATPKLSQTLPQVLAVHEIEHLLAVIDLTHPMGQRDLAIIELLYGSGLRVSELTHLTLGQVHMEANLLRILGKGAKERQVPLGGPAKQALHTYLLQHRAKFSPAPAHHTHVFLNRYGKRLSRISVFKLVKHWAQQANLPPTVSPHTLRHSFASHLLEGGASLRAVQALLGHESITTTEVYTHLDQAYLQQIVTSFHPLSGTKEEIIY